MKNFFILLLILSLTIYLVYNLGIKYLICQSYFPGIGNYNLYFHQLVFKNEYYYYEQMNQMSTFRNKRIQRTNSSLTYEVDYIVKDRTKDNNLEVRLIYPQHDFEGKLPLFVYHHGGGWSLNSIDSYERLLRRIADQAKVAIYAVNYRKAPEHPYPYAIEDAIEGLQHLYEMRHQYEEKIDFQSVYIGGDSAGGQISVSLLLILRDYMTGGRDIEDIQSKHLDLLPTDLYQTIKGQILIYPALFYPLQDLQRFSSYGHPLRTYGYGIDMYTCNSMWSNYFHPNRTLTKYVSPLSHEDDFSNLPESVLIAARYDILIDEGIEYHNTLLKSGIKSNHYIQLRYHGEFNSAVSEDVIDRIATMILHSENSP